MRKLGYTIIITLVVLLFIHVLGCNSAHEPEAVTPNRIQGSPNTPSRVAGSGTVPISLELTYPAGKSPKVFTTGWVFGAQCWLNPGTGEQQDISDRVRWSGDAVFAPATGKLSHPTFKYKGENLIVLEAAYGENTVRKQYTISAVSPIGYARFGDVALCPADSHGCPACPHAVKGPIISGSPDVLLNGKPAARVGDKGIHAGCCGPNTFEIVTGDPEVLINGKPAARKGDRTQHCGGTGQIIEGEAIGGGGTGGTPKTTTTPTPSTPAKTITPPTATTPVATAGLLVWVRDNSAVVNVNKDPLESQPLEPRFAGSFTKMTVSETSFTTKERYVDHEREYYNVTITCNFDAPPPVLDPGQRYKIRANFSHGGTHKEGGEGIGEQFWYSSPQKGSIDPPTVLKYYPWSPNFDGSASKEWTLTAPPLRPGATFQIYAGLWNRPACNVTWTYRAKNQ